MSLEPVEGKWWKRQTLEFEVKYGGGRSQKQHTIYTAGEPDQQLCSEQPNGSSFVPLLGLQAPDEFYKIKIKIKREGM